MKGFNESDHIRALDTDLPRPKYKGDARAEYSHVSDMTIRPKGGRGTLSQEALESRIPNLDKVLGHKLPNPRRNRNAKVYSDGNFSTQGL